ncbi:MAG: hypothetical protein IKB65_02190 [Ruminiclostridium sp.]|nr:hypothetical protein [Ruminiclostridium sp.]
MRKALISAALILAVALSAAGCGAENAGTSAYRWNGTQSQQDLARGTPEDHDGRYYADSKGRVDDFQKDGKAEHTEDDLKKAGEDLLKGTEDAGKSIGKATEEVLDGMTGTPKNSSR